MQKSNLEEVMKNGTKLAKSFINFNSKAFSPYNAVDNAEKLLKLNNFVQLKEQDQWELKGGEFYYLKRGYNSSLVAFHVPKNFNPDNSLFKIIGSHTDSPCLRIAPKFEYTSSGYNQACLQTYGGGLWHTWLDRPLGLGGRVTVKGKDGGLVNKLYASKKALAKVPTMCIHLKSSNPLDIKNENDLKPILSTKILEQLNCGEDGECTGLR